MNGRIKATLAKTTIALMLLANQGVLALVPALAAAKVAKFEVTTVTSAKVGEAVDLTVKALDAAGQAVKAYNGTVLITVENDPKATVPFEEEGYTFAAADQGVKNFAKGLIFSKEGKMTVSVLDIENENVEGSATVTVGGSSSSATPVATGSGDTVSITSPEDGSTVSSGSVDIVGTAKKNTKVQIFLNAKQAGEATSDETGNFLYTLKKLDQDKNVVVVKQVDAAGKVSGESKPVSLQSGSGEGPTFTSAKIVEGTDIYALMPLHVVVTAEAKLQEVSVGLGDDNQTLTETDQQGTYSGMILAPSASGSYSLSVSLKNTAGATSKKEDALSVTVKEMKDIFKDIQVVTGDKKVTFTFGLEGAPDTATKFKFKYGVTETELTQESTTFDKDKIGKDGKYSWYIDKLDMGKYFFQIYALDKDGKEISGIRSKTIDADLSLASAGQCTIPNISGLKATKKGDEVVLTWNAATEAISYNVYKKGTDGTMNLIENVKNTTYTIHFAQDKVSFDDFAVKGVCGEGKAEKESLDFSNITRVQTGPGQVLILLSLSLLGGYFFVRRQRKMM